MNLQPASAPVHMRPIILGLSAVASSGLTLLAAGQVAQAFTRPFGSMMPMLLFGVGSAVALGVAWGFVVRTARELWAAALAGLTMFPWVPVAATLWLGEPLDPLFRLETWIPALFGAFVVAGVASSVLAAREKRAARASAEP